MSLSVEQLLERVAFLEALIEVQARFERRYNKGNPTACWEWTGTYRPPYGVLQTRGVPGLPDMTPAHRLSWILAHRQLIPDGRRILHQCDNHRCVNPAHLHLGTHEDNMREMVERGRSYKGPRRTNALTCDQKREIWESGASSRSLGAKFGVHPTAVTYWKRRAPVAALLQGGKG